MEGSAAQLCPTVRDPMDCSLRGSSLHVDFPHKNTGVGYFLLQGIFPTQGSNMTHQHWHVDWVPLSHLGSPQWLPFGNQKEQTSAPGDSSALCQMTEASYETLRMARFHLYILQNRQNHKYRKQISGSQGLGLKGADCLQRAKRYPLRFAKWSVAWFHGAYIGLAQKVIQDFP